LDKSFELGRLGRRPYISLYACYDDPRMILNSIPYRQAKFPFDFLKTIYNSNLRVERVDDKMTEYWRRLFVDPTGQKVQQPNNDKGVNKDSNTGRSNDTKTSSNPSLKGVKKEK
jgi:hypothetical protein